MSELRDLIISNRRRIPVRLLSATYARSGGPGGQNVNKVSTKVDLRLDVEGLTEFLGDAAILRIRQQLRARMDAGGRLRVTSSEHRERSRNLEAALARMEALIRSALSPQKVRKPTRPGRASNEQRLLEKKRRGHHKSLRGKLRVENQ